MGLSQLDRSPRSSDRRGRHHSPHCNRLTICSDSDRGGVAEHCAKLGNVMGTTGVSVTSTSRHPRCALTFPNEIAENAYTF
jgi:hypothetical protein